MIRKLIIITCLFSSVNIFAQSRYELRYNEKDMPPRPEKYSGNTSYKMPGDPLPDFKVISLPWVEFFFENTADGKRTEKFRETTPMRTITKKDLTVGKNLILMLFNPTCGHCEEQTELFVKNLKEFKNTQLLFVATPVMGPYMNAYAEKFHLREHPEILFGLDYDNLVEKTFLYYALPQLCIYDKDKKLVKMISGGAPMDSLRQYLN